jgi:dihydrofolate synthase/folylpolyglutamate synthase
MRELLARLGDPHYDLPVVHIAGTKGKGSTAAMTAAVLSAAGYRTGLYTSPHLDRIEERISVDGRPCDSADLVELAEEVMPPVEAMEKVASTADPPEVGPTHFDILTAMALLFFARRKVDLAVLEVGLGGRLDSTNLCRPQVSVITSISLDHTKQLGNTLESIAREEAGIVKPAVPVVSGVLDCGPREVIRQVCGQRGCRLAELGLDFGFEYHPPRRLDVAPGTGTFDFRNHREDRQVTYSGLALGLLGSHQAANAAVALAALAELEQRGWRVPEPAIRRGLAEVVCPARVELVARRPAVVVDGAHNTASVGALVRALEESFSAGRRLLVFGATQEKDVRGMLGQLLARFDRIVFTRYLDNPRAVPPEELAAAAAELTGRRYEVSATPADVWEKVRAMAAPDDLICITGSLFLASEMRRQIRAHPLPPPAESATREPCE